MHGARWAALLTATASAAQTLDSKDPRSRAPGTSACLEQLQQFVLGHALQAGPNSYAGVVDEQLRVWGRLHFGQWPALQSGAACGESRRLQRQSVRLLTSTRGATVCSWSAQEQMDASSATSSCSMAGMHQGRVESGKCERARLQQSCDAIRACPCPLACSTDTLPPLPLARLLSSLASSGFRAVATTRLFFAAICVGRGDVHQSHDSSRQH